MKTTLIDDTWKVETTVCWGQRDRWLSYDGVVDFCNDSKHRLVELPRVRNSCFSSSSFLTKLMLKLPFLSKIKK